MKRRAAVEPVIGHVKAEHRMGRNYLKGRDGDRINAVLAAAGYNFCLLLRWLADFCVPSSGPSPKLSRLKRSLKSAVVRVLHGGRSRLRVIFAVQDENTERVAGTRDQGLHSLIQQK